LEIVLPPPSRRNISEKYRIRIVGGGQILAERVPFSGDFNDENYTPVYENSKTGVTVKVATALLTKRNATNDDRQWLSSSLGRLVIDVAAVALFAARKTGRRIPTLYDLRGWLFFFPGNLSG